MFWLPQNQKKGLGNVQPRVNQFDIWSTIIRPHPSGVGTAYNREQSSNGHLLSSCKKRNATKNLTGDVLIVPLERKLAVAVVDLHAAAFARTRA